MNWNEGERVGCREKRDIEMRIEGERVQVSKWMKWEKNRMYHWAIQSGLVGPIRMLKFKFYIVPFLFFSFSSISITYILYSAIGSNNS